MILIFMDPLEDKISRLDLIPSNIVHRPKSNGALTRRGLAREEPRASITNAESMAH